MSVTRVTSSIDRAKSKIPTGNLAVGNKGIYDVRYEIGDYTPDMLVTYYILLSLLPVTNAPLPLTILSTDPLPKRFTSLGAFQNGFTNYSQNIVSGGVKIKSVNDVTIEYSWTGSTLNYIDVSAHQGLGEDVLIELF